MIMKKRLLRKTALLIIFALLVTLLQPSAYADSGNTQDNLVDDQAYVSNLSISQIEDGTPVWDSDDNPGNDSGPDNRIVRTFDVVTYTLHYITNLQNQTAATYFKNGYLYVRFELPCTLAEASFDIDSMTWLIDAEQKEENGKVVLTGKRYITSDSVSAIPGEGTLSAVVNVLGMKNGDTLEPVFTAWMQGNDAIQEQSVTADPVTVSAAPSYNIQVIRNTGLALKDTFDFSTGIAGADNQSLGQVTGRMYGYGVTIQLMNPDQNKKLKGLEFPKGEITFDLDLMVEKGTTDITGTGSGEILPLLWDYEGNNTTTNTGNLGRNMYFSNTATRFAWLVAPNNTGADYRSCVDGGSWSAAQSGKTISVSVDAYSLITAQGEYFWPTHNAGNGTASVVSYGEDKGIGCFSAGYFQILFPIPATVDDSATYYLTVSDTNMQATSLSDVAVTDTDQAKKTDDVVRTEVTLSPPGSYDKGNYTTNSSQTDNPWTTNLSTINNGQSGDAWTTPGSIIEIWGSFHNGLTNDLDQYPYAVNILQKFDDKAFQPLADADGTPTSTVITGSMQYTLLYAAKPGGVGWDSDTEMNEAEEDDLEYFATMADLKTAYPEGVCVAVLIEGREGAAALERNYIGFNVQVLDTAEIGTVYQTTNTVRIWKKENGSQMTKADTRLSNDPAVIAVLSTQDVLLDGTGKYSTSYGPYIKSEYDESGQVKSGTHSPSTYYSGASVLIVGITAQIAKSVDQVSSGSPKVAYDVGAGQRRVDYVLTPSVTLANGTGGTAALTTTVTITDTLPKGISVTAGTKYYLGGTYTPDNTPYGGSLAGGTELALAPGYPLSNADGTTTLKWIIEDVVPGEPMEQIHFSANIGTPGDNDTDVSNGERLLNTVQIQAEGDGRSVNGIHGNLATYSISIIKLSQSALVKSVRTPLVEMGEDIIYQITHNNISSNDYETYSLLDILPANGDGRGTDYDGSYTTKVTIDLSSSTSQMTQINIAATGTDQTGTTANTVNPAEFTAQDSVASGNTITTTLPQGSTAFYITGILGALDSLKVTVTLIPDGNEGGNTYCNDVTAAVNSADYILAPTVTATVVKRTVKGTVWHDANKDGQYQAEEKLIEGVKVTLIDEATNQAAMNVLGNEVAPVYTDAYGDYTFTGLGQGSYIVRFESSSQFDISYFTVTQKNIGNDATDSDADGIYDTDGSLLKAEIGGIVLPSKASISIFGYTSENNDAGLIGSIPVQLKLEGIKNLSGGGKTNAAIQAGQFQFTIDSDSGNDTSGYSRLPTGAVSVSQGGTINLGSLTFTKEGTYKFVVTETDRQAGGYSYDADPVTVTVTVTLDNNALALKTTVVYEKSGQVTTGINFYNTYTLRSAGIILKAEKKLTGRSLQDGEFNFEVKENGTVIATGTNKTDGTVEFTEIRYTEPGVHTYTVSEVSGSLSGITYDTAEAAVTVTVTDKGDGTMTVTPVYPNGPIVFTNIYQTEPANVSIPITKVITGDTPSIDSTFTFELNGNDGYQDSVTITGAGSTEFGMITYTGAGTYVYTVTERKGDEEGYTYDTGIYTVTVTVTDIGGVLEAKYSIVAVNGQDGQEAEAIVFTNTYKKDEDEKETETDSDSLTVKKSADCESIQEGANIVYTIRVVNVGNTVLTGIRVRDYVPEYTTYVSAGDNGEYGAIGGKEHVTWFIEELKPGEEVELIFEVKADACIPVGQIENTALYKVTGSKENPGTNYEKDPTVRTNQVVTKVISEDQTVSPTKTERETVSPAKTEDNKAVILSCLTLLFTMGYVIIKFSRRKNTNRG